MTSVRDALAAARAAGLDRLDAQLLLAHHLQRPRSWLLAHDDAALDAGIAAALQADIDRRAAGVPLAYLTGRKDFHGLTLRVTPQVLVPRPDTETLVDWAIELAARATSPTIVDLGTGSGAIALAVKAARPTVQMTATDASAAALGVARGNADALGLAVRFAAGDWWAAVGDERFALALSNPPYIAAGDPHLPALVHEPGAALVSGADGLEAIRTIVGGAAGHLQRDGWLLLEHGHDQAAAVTGLLRRHGFADVGSRADLAGILRCSGGRLP